MYAALIAFPSFEVLLFPETSALAQRKAMVPQPRLLFFGEKRETRATYPLYFSRRTKPKIPPRNFAQKRRQKQFLSFLFPLFVFLPPFSKYVIVRLGMCCDFHSYAKLRFEVAISTSCSPLYFTNHPNKHVQWNSEPNCSMAAWTVIAGICSADGQRLTIEGENRSVHDVAGGQRLAAKAKNDEPRLSAKRK